jgi:hypothetical protein
MAIAGNITVALRAQTSQFDSSLKKSSRRVSGWSKSVQKAVSYATQAFAAYKVYDFAKTSVKAFMEQEDASNNLASAYKVLGVHSIDAMKRAEEFASSIQKMTVIGDEAVLQLMQLGASMGQLAGKDLERATIATIGLSRAFKIDTTAAMKLVAKAALGNVDTLTRYGIVLDESLTKQEKFNEVLKIGEKNFQLAQREIDTTAGKLKQLSNTWGDMKEGIGEHILRYPALGETFTAPAKAKMSEYKSMLQDRKKAKKLMEELEGTPGPHVRTNEYLRNQVAKYEELRDAIAGAKPRDDLEEKVTRNEVMYWERDRKSAAFGLNYARTELAVAEATTKRANAVKYFSSVWKNLKSAGGDSAGMITGIINKPMEKLANLSIRSRMRDMQEMSDRAAEIFSETRTPMERYDSKINELDKLLKKEIITFDTYARAVAAANDELASFAEKDVGYRSPGFGQAVGYRNTPNMPQNTQQTMTIQRQQTSLLGEIKNATRETANALKKPASSVAGGGFTQ